MESKKISELEQYNGSANGFMVPGVADGETQKADLGAMVDQAAEAAGYLKPSGLKTINGESIAGQGDIALEIANPFKGWFKTGDTLPATGVSGDYLYFKDTAASPVVTTIYRWNGTAFENTNTVVDESNVQTFGSGQAVNGVYIKDLNGNNDPNAAGVLSAEAGKALKNDLYGTDTDVEGEELVGTYIKTDYASGLTKSWKMNPSAGVGGNVIVGSGGAVIVSTLIVAQDKWDSIRTQCRRIKVTANSSNACYLFFSKKFPSNADHTFDDLQQSDVLCSGTTQDNMFIYIGAGATKIVEIPGDAARCSFSFVIHGSSSSRTPQSVIPLVIEHTPGRLDELEIDVVNNLTTAAPTKALSAEQGKVLKDEVDKKLGNDFISETDTDYYSFNLINWDAVTLHAYINKNNGNEVSLSSSQSQCATDYIPVEAGKSYLIKGLGTYGSVGASAVYDSNKVYLREMVTSSEVFTAQEGDGFIRLTLGGDSTGNNLRTVLPMNGDGTKPDTSQLITAYIKGYYKQTVKQIGIDGVFSLDNMPQMYPLVSSLGQFGLGKETDAIEAGSTLTCNSGQEKKFPVYIKTCHNLAFKGLLGSALSGSDYIILGLNGGSYHCFSVALRITPNEVQFCDYSAGAYRSRATASHGLTIDTFVMLQVDLGWHGLKLRLVSSDGAFVKTWSVSDIASMESGSYPEFGGDCFVTTSIALTNVKLRHHSDRLRKPVWILGDSYMSMYTKRWPYQLIYNYGIEDFLVSGYAGAKSEDMYPELERLLNYSTPQYLIWALGMNDMYDVTFKQYATFVEKLCRERGITLIYQTIPQPNLGAGYDKTQINAFIRSRGYRYIDAYSAVCTGSGSTWYTGMQYDNAHPTELGAMAIAGQALVDFPEIANY